MSESDTMKIGIDFSKIEALQRAFEKAADDDQIRAVNRQIVEEAQPLYKREMAKRIPQSADISKSGRGFGTKSSVTTHAANAVPMEKPRFRGTAASGEVGWTKADNSEHFYVKFIEWGTIYQPPREFIVTTAQALDGRLRAIAERKYQEFLGRTINNV